jgi:hypothetical protein
MMPKPFILKGKQQPDKLRVNGSFCCLLSAGLSDLGRQAPVSISSGEQTQGFSVPVNNPAGAGHWKLIRQRGRQ